MIKRLRAGRFDGARLEIVLDLGRKEFEITMVGVPDAEADRLEAVAQRFGQDGNVRDALITLRSQGWSLWLEIDEATMQFLIRELGANDERPADS